MNLICAQRTVKSSPKVHNRLTLPKSISRLLTQISTDEISTWNQPKKNLPKFRCKISVLPPTSQNCKCMGKTVSTQREGANKKHNILQINFNNHLFLPGSVPLYPTHVCRLFPLFLLWLAAFFGPDGVVSVPNLCLPPSPQDCLKWALKFWGKTVFLGICFFACDETLQSALCGRRVLFLAFMMMTRMPLFFAETCVCRAYLGFVGGVCVGFIWVDLYNFCFF